MYTYNILILLEIPLINVANTFVWFSLLIQVILVANNSSLMAVGQEMSKPWHPSVHARIGSIASKRYVTWKVFIHRQLGMGQNYHTKNI